jgi:hypothetical protein
MRTAGRAELSDEAVLNQHVNRVGSGLTGKRDHSHLAQQQRGHRDIIA